MSIPPYWNDSHLRVGVRGAAYLSPVRRSVPVGGTCASVAGTGADRCAHSRTDTVHFTSEVIIRGKPIAPGR